MIRLDLFLYRFDGRHKHAKRSLLVGNGKTDLRQSKAAEVGGAFLNQNYSKAIDFEVCINFEFSSL